MSDFLDRMKTLHAAEDFFELLDVPFDRQVLGIARLHILRRMGQSVAGLDAAAGEDEQRAICRTALLAAYEEFTRRSPIETRLFKVLRDRDPQQPAKPGSGFVPLSALTGTRS